MKVETRRDTPICHSKIIQYGLAQSLITEEFPRNPAASIRWSIMRVLCPYNNSGVQKGLHYSNPWFRCCLKQSQLAMWSRVSWTVGFPAFTSQVLGGGQAFATMLLCSPGVGSRALCMLHVRQLL